VGVCCAFSIMILLKQENKELDELEIANKKMSEILKEFEQKFEAMRKELVVEEDEDECF
jgi:hypothetical protein